MLKSTLTLVRTLHDLDCACVPLCPLLSIALTTGNWLMIRNIWWNPGFSTQPQFSLANSWWFTKSPWFFYYVSTTILSLLVHDDDPRNSSHEPLTIHFHWNVEPQGWLSSWSRSHLVTCMHNHNMYSCWIWLVHVTPRLPQSSARTWLSHTSLILKVRLLLNQGGNTRRTDGQTDQEIGR